MRDFDGYKKTGTDEQIEDRIAEHCARHSISPLAAVQLFPVLARRHWLKRFLAQVELFKLTLDVPGDIAELGVFRGWGLFTWANLLESFSVGDRSKSVFGFDNWKGYTEVTGKDGPPVDFVDKASGGFSPAAHREELRSAIAIFDADRFVPWKPRIRLIEGDIEDTTKAFAAENRGVRFSLIHFDCDMYVSTKAALEAFWPLLSRGGVMLFGQYAIEDWAGETNAVDEFFADKPAVRIRKLPWNNVPGGYVIKD